MSINSIDKIENQRKIAILDTSSISFLQHLNQRCQRADDILKDYDLILIPGWVWEEISDSTISVSYVEELIQKGYPIFKIDEERYSQSVDEQEWNLYQIVKASVNQLGQVKSYLRRCVEKSDPLDMDAYTEWINQLYDKWPIQGNILPSGRQKRKNAGEVSITILAEILSWYYPNSEMITVYSQDSDTKMFQNSADEQLRKVFSSRIPVPVSFKSNDVILCQLFRDGAISEEDIRYERKSERKITYSKALEDKSVVLVTKLTDSNDFINLMKDNSVQIVF